MKLLSVSVSMGKEVPYMGKTVTTGIFKEPVGGRCRHAGVGRWIHCSLDQLRIHG